MVRFLIFLVIAAVIFYFGRQYYLEHQSEPVPTPAADTSPDATQDSTPPPAANATPLEQNLSTCKTQILGLSRGLLRPIEASRNYSTDKAATQLNTLEAQLQQYRLEPGFRRVVEACGLIEQALKERSNYQKQSEEKNEGTTLDKVPGNWVNKDVSLNASSGTVKPVDPTKSNLQSRNDFFHGAAEREWRDRINFYKPQIERLLAF